MLHEGLQFRIPEVFVNVLVNLRRGSRASFASGAGKERFFARRMRAIDRHPAHHPRVEEFAVARRAPPRCLRRAAASYRKPKSISRVRFTQKS